MAMGFTSCLSTCRTEVTREAVFPGAHKRAGTPVAVLPAVASDFEQHTSCTSSRVRAEGANTFTFPEGSAGREEVEMVQA